jgi:phospholipase C
MKQLMCSILVMSAMAAIATAQVPQSAHVVVVVEENHSYSQVIGNSSMPYLNSLANKYGLAVNYYGNTHPSIGNYFMLSTGKMITNDDRYTGTVTSNNLVRVALTSGVTWKSYAESLPWVGYTGGDRYPYSRHHNPFTYISEVVNSSSEKYNLVPFTRFAQDLANDTLPRFSFIIPNMHHNMHDCPTGMSSCTESQKAAAADYWLKTKIAPLLADSEFQKSGLLIITWDEGRKSDTAHGGGKVATVMIGPKVKRGYRSTKFYQEQNLLKTVVKALGGTSAPGAASTAAPMSDFF